jgi:type I restriction enzyme S subunit
MFGDPILNPLNFEVRKLKDLSKKISDGVHAKPNYTTDGKPFISVVNMNTGMLDFSGCKYVSEEDYAKMIKSTHPERGDVLYTKVGATYGIPAYVSMDREFCLYVSVCLIKPKHNLIDAEFLVESMRLPYVKRQADSRIRGIGVPDLHLNQIREFDILTPPIEHQESFVEFVHKVDKSKFWFYRCLNCLQVVRKNAIMNLSRRGEMERDDQF